MSLVLYQTRSGEGSGAFSEDLDQLMMTLDDISGKGDSFDLWGAIRRLGDQRGGSGRREAQVWQVDVTGEGWLL